MSIDASGTVLHDGVNPAGPDGDSNPALTQFNLVAGHHAALLARIDSGSPLVVGAADTIFADRAGRLWLGINDVGTENNAGQFSVSVKVTPAAG